MFELKQSFLQLNLRKNNFCVKNTLRLKNSLESNLLFIKKIEYELYKYVEILQIYKIEKSGKALSLIQTNHYSFVNKNTEFSTKYLLNRKFDSYGCFLEIHSGTGGIESEDWVKILYRMYTKWMEKSNLSYYVLYSSSGTSGGIKYIICKIASANSYGRLKTENGVHRLIRISPFNSKNKRHTSFASATIFPILKRMSSVTINPVNLKFDSYRSSGAGGQHVNTTNSAIRITHIPTKIVAQCQNNKSQHRNKEECLSILKAKLFCSNCKSDKLKNGINSKKSIIGWGNQIRSYVLYPYKVIKDLRSNFESKNIVSILNGNVDLFMVNILSLQNINKDIYSYDINC